jgi:hypothetical protein
MTFWPVFEKKVCKSCLEEKNIALCFVPDRSICKSCKSRKQKELRKPGTDPTKCWKGLKFDLQSRKKE